MTSDLKQDRYTIICVFFVFILESTCCQELWNLGFIAHDFRQAQHIHYTLVSELAWLISCETVCFLRNFNVTDNDFEHARYALPHYITHYLRNPCKLLSIKGYDTWIIFFGRYL